MLHFCCTSVRCCTFPYTFVRFDTFLLKFRQIYSIVNKLSSTYGNERHHAAVCSNVCEQFYGKSDTSRPKNGNI